MEPEKFSNWCRAGMVLLCGVRESRVPFLPRGTHLCTV